MRLIVATLATLFCFVGYGKDTTRRGLRTDATVANRIAARYDTLGASQAGQHIVVTGYEKPLRSTKETVMIHLSDDAPAITKVILDIEYYDMSGYALHKRKVEIPVESERSSTRFYAFKSWDINKVFYYHLNPPPRTRAQGTPYYVSVTVSGALLPHRKTR